MLVDDLLPFLEVCRSRRLPPVVDAMLTKLHD